MATCNFWLKNAQSYYAFNDTYNTINDEGEEVEVTRDECEWDDLLDCICYRGEEGKFFTCPSTETYNRRMDARNICETNTDWQTFVRQIQIGRLLATAMRGQQRPTWRA